MTQRTFEDPVLELALRFGGGAEDVIDLATDVTDEEAEIVLEVLDEVEAEESAASIVGRLRLMGHAL